MKRRIEDHKIETERREREAFEFCLDAREQRIDSPLVVKGRSEAILLIRQKVNRDRKVSAKRQPVTHPTIARTQVKDA